MAAYNTETITYVHHWNETLFSIRTTRDAGLRFKNGQFVMIGLEVAGKPLVRAYSIASANHDDELEFFSIKVPDGPLTSRLQKVQVGDKLLINKRPTGTLILDDLLPGKNLYCLATGTGLAPFISVVQDAEIYERFEKIIVVHGVREVSELAYKDFFEKEMLEHEYFGELAKEKLIYYPTVTREEFKNQGRLTDLIESGKLFEDIGMPRFDPAVDRAMICGSPAMLEDTCALLDKHGMTVSKRMGVAADYVIERAFTEKS